AAAEPDGRGRPRRYRGRDRARTAGPPPGRQERDRRDPAEEVGVAMRARARIAAIALVAGCAHGGLAREPAAAVRAEVTQAETAEKARRHDVARTHYQRAIAEAHDPVSAAYA